MSIQEFNQEPDSFLGKIVKFVTLHWKDNHLVPVTRTGIVAEIDGTAVNISSEGTTHCYHTTSLKFCDIQMMVR